MNYKIYLLPLLMINNFYTAQEKLIDDIVAKINDVPILYSDIQNIINSMKYTKEANKINEGKKIEIVYRFQDELVTAARLAEQIGKTKQEVAV